MASIESEPYRIQRSFFDFDELAVEARQWDLDFTQLDSGQFYGRLLQFGLDNIHIAEACFTRTLNQKGAPPAGFRTIVVPAKRNVQFVWRGQQINGNHLLIFPAGSELSSVSQPDFHVYTCSFSERLLSAVCESLQLPELDDLCGNSEVVHCSSGSMNHLRRTLRELCVFNAKDVPSSILQLYKTRLSEILPKQILQSIATSIRSCSVATSEKREQAICVAESYISRTLQCDISVTAVCLKAEVSQRTLEYAFMERFGMNPKVFIRTSRLNAVRKALRVADPSRANVKDIALKYGFWHAGQFAEDYSNLFNELPSQTLKKVP